MDKTQDYVTTETESDSSDRLSELPDSLILVILSLLQMRDAVRTTILSKRWKNLWITVPWIDFSSFNTNRDFICGVVTRWKGAKILKFSLCFFWCRPQTNDLDSWLLFAIEKQVEELLLEVGCPRDISDNEYCAPQRLYSCSSLTKLSLNRCELKVEENVQWNQLKRLKLEGLESLSEDALNRFLAGSPLLEEMILCFWKMTENLNIQSTSLKMLHIGRYNRGFSGEVINAVLRIRAPNLLTLEISAFFYGNNCLLDVPCLTNAILHFQMLEEKIHLAQFSASRMFNHVCHVEKVTLSVFCSQFLVSLKRLNMVVPFTNAKFLKLYAFDAEEMLHVLEMFPKLMILKVELDQEDIYMDYTLSGEDIHEAVVVACNSFGPKMPLPSPTLLRLKTIKLTWCLRQVSIIPAVEILLENALMLEKMVLRLSTYLANPETFTLAEEKVMSMSRSSPTAQVIISKL